MKNNNDHDRHEKHKGGGSAFFWGLIIGALLATLITTKRGRRVLRELSELSLELIENFIEERVGNQKSKVTQDDEATAKEDIESEITEEEAVEEFERVPDVAEEEKIIEKPPVAAPVAESITREEKTEPETNGHKKRRLFRGIRRTK